MTRLIIFACLAVALVGAGAGTMLRSHSLMSGGTAAMPTIQQLHSFANVDKLPTQDFDDRSLVFPREAKRGDPNWEKDRAANLTGP
ncbi:MAG: hypothetical protein JO283_14435 [Bradyrhizobium sp.]|jgi:hypothetical protein|nr:hypothetical protein [Bradyrhizobium sp.]